METASKIREERRPKEHLVYARVVDDEINTLRKRASRSQCCTVPKKFESRLKPKKILLSLHLA